MHFGWGFYFATNPYQWYLSHKGRGDGKEEAEARFQQRIQSGHCLCIGSSGATAPVRPSLWFPHLGCLSEWPGTGWSFPASLFW